MIPSLIQLPPMPPPMPQMPSAPLLSAITNPRTAAVAAALMRHQQPGMIDKRFGYYLAAATMQPPPPPVAHYQHHHRYPQQYQQPKTSQTPCRLGVNCKFKRENKCKYYHAPNEAESSSLPSAASVSSSSSASSPKQQDEEKKADVLVAESRPIVNNETLVSESSSDKDLKPVVEEKPAAVSSNALESGANSDESANQTTSMNFNALLNPYRNLSYVRGYNFDSLSS